MSDFDSNPFADPDFSNPFQVANLAMSLTAASAPSEARHGVETSADCAHDGSLGVRLGSYELIAIHVI